MSSSVFTKNLEIKDGEYTKTIYTMIMEQRYTDSIQILANLLQSHPNVSFFIYLLIYI